MKRMVQASLVIALASVFATGCAHLPGKCDLGKVAKDAQLQNVTTGDGTFENYLTTGYYTSTELGLAFGLPGIVKLLEVCPVQDDTTQMLKIAQDAKKAGATSVINAKPPTSFYSGFPFLFFGIYVDNAAGTGIKAK